MSCKHRWYMTVLALALVAPGIALAEEEFIGPWHSHRDCPRSEYSVLHYWAPYIYKTRAVVHPSMLDQYPPGPYPPVPAVVELTRYPCRTAPSMPTSPYSDPAAYYGRVVAPR